MLLRQAGPAGNTLAYTSKGKDVALVSLSHHQLIRVFEISGFCGGASAESYRMVLDQEQLFLQLFLQLVLPKSRCWKMLCCRESSHSSSYNDAVCHLSLHLNTNMINISHTTHTSNYSWEVMRVQSTIPLVNINVFGQFCGVNRIYFTTGSTFYWESAN